MWSNNWRINVVQQCVALTVLRTLMDASEWELRLSTNNDTNIQGYTLTIPNFMLFVTFTSLFDYYRFFLLEALLIPHFHFVGGPFRVYLSIYSLCQPMPGMTRLGFCLACQTCLRDQVLTVTLIPLPAHTEY